MEYQWNKCYSIGTNRTNGRVECTPTQPEADGNILSPYIIRCISLIEHQWNKCYSIGTNRRNRTNGRVECAPTHPEANGNIVSPCNEMHFTNRIPIE